MRLLSAMCDLLMCHVAILIMLNELLEYYIIVETTYVNRFF